MTSEMSRRQWLLGVPAGLGAGLAVASATAAPTKPAPTAAFSLSLNTSTIRGQKLSLVEEIDLAARAGYDAIEPWVHELEHHAADGSSLADIGKRIRDRGLRVESSIGFFEWVVDDAEQRKKGLEKARQSMELVRKIGGKRIAAPPFGATKQENLNLLRAAERYRTLLELGDRMGVIPQVEVWGFSKALSRLGETALVAIESGHPKACVLADVYHLYKGGSGFETVKLLSASAMQVFHLNDYPATPPRARIADKDRIYPGDGIAPLKQLVRDLRRLGFHGILSLELFNPEYYKQDALTVVRTGLEKMRTLVRASAEG
jgi:2-keto-myo-inositol isomerase